MDCQTTISEPSSPVPSNPVEATTQTQTQKLQQQPSAIPTVAGSSAPSTTTAGAVTTTSANVVAVPVAVVPPPEDIYTYVCVKGSLHDINASIFGLNPEEMSAIAKRFSIGTTETVNGIMVRTSPMEVINALSKLGYKVVCSTGEVEIVWTMQREI